MLENSFAHQSPPHQIKTSCNNPSLPPFNTSLIAWYNIEIEFQWKIKIFIWFQHWKFVVMRVMCVRNSCFYCHNYWFVSLNCKQLKMLTFSFPKWSYFLRVYPNRNEMDHHSRNENYFNETAKSLFVKNLLTAQAVNSNQIETDCL